MSYWLVCLLMLSALAGPPAGAADTRTVAGRLTGDIMPRLIEKSAGSRVYYVAVYPMANVDGELTGDLATYSRTVSLALVDSLKEASRPYSIIPRTPSAMGPWFDRLQPGELARETPEQRQALLTKLRLDALIFSRINLRDCSGLKSGELSLSASAIFKDGSGSALADTTQSYAVNDDLLSVLSHGDCGPASPVIPRDNDRATDLAGVDILVDGEPLPLSRCRDGLDCRARYNPEIDYSRTLFLRLDSRRHRGKEYQLRINRFDEDQGLIGVAASVDGVSVFLDDDKVGHDRFVSRSPFEDRKWLIGPANHRVGCDGNDYQLYPTPGSGPARLEIRGFQSVQHGNAYEFRLADEPDSVANRAGITGKTGEIMVHFFRDSSRSFPAWDSRPRSESATTTGTKVASATCSVRTFHAEVTPRYSIKIIYRYEDEPLPVDEQNLVTF